MRHLKWPKELGYKDIDLDLKRMSLALDRLDNPQNNLPEIIHIAGTNGKFSVLKFLSIILKSYNFKIHEYISPHLIDYNERIILSGKKISDNSLKKYLNICKNAVETEPKINTTFFENLTLAAFLAFSNKKADFLLLETGMGGKYDATNIVKNNLLSIITSISLDHQKFLGDNIGKIAYQKAGIIKNDSITLSGSQQKNDIINILEIEAKKKNNDFFSYGKDFSYRVANNNHIFIKIFDYIFEIDRFYDIFPYSYQMHQIENFILSLSAAHIILNKKNKNLNKKNIIYAMKNIKLPARFEKITKGIYYKKFKYEYNLYLDISHNIASSVSLARNLRMIKKRNTKNYAIIAMMKDKDIADFLKYISGYIDFIVTIDLKNNDRSINKVEISKIAYKLGINAVYADNIDEAFNYILSLDNYKKKNIYQRIINKKKSNIIITGSIYLASEFMIANKMINE